VLPHIISYTCSAPITDEHWRIPSHVNKMQIKIKPLKYNKRQTKIIFAKIVSLLLTACLNAFMSPTARMSEGRAFHAEGPACEKERSPNLDRSLESKIRG